MKENFVRKLVVGSMLTALGAVLMYLNVPIPFMPPFLKLDLSEVPVLIGAFALGIPWGIAIAVIKNIIHALFGTTTMYVGELSNAILSCSVVIVTGLIYRSNKTTKGAIIALLASIVTTIIVGAIINRYFILQAYVSLMGFKMEAIIGMCKAANPNINSVDAYIWYGVVPFNFIKSTIGAVITFFVYKRISNIIVKM